MIKTSAVSTNFEGLEVVAFESRRAPEMAVLIARLGGVPRVAPALRESPLEEDAALAFGTALFAGRLDAVIFMTGAGTRRLFEVLETRHARDQIVQALAGISVVARGPKPVKVLRELKVPVTIAVPEPNTWHEVLDELDENPRGFTLAGSRVAVQEYGVPNEAFLAALKERGVEVLRVPVYQWTLPQDIQPLREAIQALVEGRAQVALFTNSAQVDHLLRVAAEDGTKDLLLEALEKVVVASVGPTCSETLVSHGIPIDLEPVRPKMGLLVQETAQRAKVLLKKKREVRSEKLEGPASRVPNPESRTPNPEPRVPNPESRVPSPESRDRAAWEDSRFLKACRFEAVDATPVWLMRQAGRYMKEYRELRARVSFLELCKNPALVSEVTVTAVEKLGVDAAIIFADLLLIVEPLGLHLEYDKREGPVVSPGLREAADIDRLHDVDPEQSLGYFYDAIRQTRSDLNPRLPLIGFAGCPFTLASYLIEGGGSKNYRHTKALMYRDAGAWRALMERLARSLARYINGQIDAGVQAVQVFDTWVGCLGPADYRDYVQPYTRMMLQAVKPGTPIIHFGTGTAMLLEAMRDAGGDVIGVDSHVELDEAWRRLGDGVGVQGNLDPMVLYGAQNFIRMRAKRVLNQAAYRTGHIFNLGHGLLPDTPYENVVALVKMVHDISSYQIAKGRRPPRVWKGSRKNLDKD
ncbi:MAG: uroporphyrinogen decarboxylase [Terriglobia bacterium]|jgi:uroporphyrinogen decarboxylase